VIVVVCGAEDIIMDLIRCWAGKDLEAEATLNFTVAIMPTK